MNLELGNRSEGYWKSRVVMMIESINKIATSSERIDIKVIEAQLNETNIYMHMTMYYYYVGLYEALVATICNEQVR
ncbi:hypothetical protein [Breznakia pachnodae]|uniref:Uncharacterized protein n=1 Tax=Breznakia pachnodae TaxID=265178 RepID=A0ABU0E429_9FIRM|nr:hypothetical protein [Breznakia pachnodae]MDQ0361560.1 hypothetical protein [Breznakia pachnodae]